MVKGELSVTCRLHVGYTSRGTYLFCYALGQRGTITHGGGSFQYDSRAPSRVTSIGFTPVGGTPFH